MKTLHYHLFIFISLISFTALADGICRNSNICWLPVNNNPWWKYKATARVNYLMLPRQDVGLACPGMGTGGYAHAQIMNNCAWQIATNNFGKWYFSGSVFKNKRICGRGNSYSDLYQKYVTDKYVNETDNGEEKSTINVSETIFLAERVQINSVKGELSLNDDALFSSFEIVMWLPSSSEDSIWTEKNTFYNGKIHFTKGVISTSGDFPKNAFQLIEDNQGNIKCLFDLKITTELPKGVNGLTDLIEVVGISDAGASVDVMFEEGFSIFCNIYPNPTTRIINIKLNTTNSLNEIVIYDKDGNLLKSLTPEINNSTKTYSISIENSLPQKNQYILYLNTLQGILIRKIEIE